MEEFASICRFKVLLEHINFNHFVKFLCSWHEMVLLSLVSACVLVL